MKAQQHYKIHFYSLLLFAFFLPIYPRLATPFIAIAVVNWFFSGQINSKIKRLLNPLPIIFSSFYIIHLIGLLYTTDIMEGARDVETKLTLFLFPLLLFSVPFKDYFLEKRQLLQAFIIGSLFSSIYCFIYAVYTQWTTGYSSFSYRDLSDALDAHPAYQGIYMGFALFTIIHYYFFSREKPLFEKKINLLLAIFFLVMVFLFNSRTVILATTILFIITILILSIQKLGILKALGVTGLFGILLIAILLLIPATNRRINYTIKSFQIEQSKSDENKVNIRFLIWESGIEAIQSNPIIGTGTGDIQNHLMSIYKKNKITLAIMTNYNAHNQFIQTTIALGAIGLIILILNFVIPLILGFKSKDYLLLMFLLSFLIFSLTESALEKQQGVLYYAFFNSLLAIGFMYRK